MDSKRTCDVYITKYIRDLTWEGVRRVCDVWGINWKFEIYLLVGSLLWSEKQRRQNLEAVGCRFSAEKLVQNIL